MTADDEPKKLNNDPAREAVDSLRGYSYQILRSVEAWIELSEGQILVLEGAEDLDRVDPSGALVEQVKDTLGSGNITLNSSNALAALGNFWSHVERNPGTTIQFRYLTTSGYGQERDEDFSLSRPGIDAWESIRKDATNPDRVAEAKAILVFLAGKSGLPLAMKDWLGSASVEDFVSRVISPFQWLTRQSGIDAVTTRIEAKLIEMGESKGIGAADAMAALAQLHFKAWENATDPNRPPLRRGDALRILDAAGSVTLPMSQLKALIHQLTDPGTAQAQVFLAGSPLSGLPVRRTRRFSRTRLETEIARALRSGTVLIHGSTGTGKTDLSAAVLSMAGGVVWLDLRDMDQVALAARIDAATNTIECQQTPTALVLDDFDAGGDPRSLLPPIGRLMAVLDKLGVSLLVTSAQRLPPRIASGLGLSEERIFTAPHFEVEEVADYFAEEGCPPRDVDTWSKIVHASTSGHPQLVDARLRALQEQAWPAPSIKEWIEPTTELVDIRAEARRMVSALRSEDRELLARSSLVLGRVSRTRLMAIASIAPAIAEPGDAIDRLVGPWLELTDTTELRLSPLLRNLGVDTRGQAWSGEMHAGIAWAWLADRRLLATDVSTLLMHAMVSGRIGPLVQMLPGLLDASKDVWQQIGETCSIFASIGLNKDARPPFSTAIDLGVFRILQLRIAAESDRDQIPLIAAAAFYEADQRTTMEMGASFFDFMFLWQLVGLENMERSVGDAVELTMRFVHASEKVRASLSTYGDEGSQLAADWADLTPVVAMIIQASVQDRQTFDELLAIAESKEPQDRLHLLFGQSQEIDLAGHMLDRLWLSEIRSANPDWVAFADSLNRAADFARANGAQSFLEAVAALLVRVTDENLADPQAAIDVASRLCRELDAPDRVIAAKAKVLWRRGDLADAIKLYDQLLPGPGLPKPYSTDVFRESAIAAARFGDWARSAEGFAAAIRETDRAEMSDRRVGLCFDHGLALHEAGDTQSAVDAFAAAIDSLVADGRDLPPEPLISVRQMGSQLVKQVAAETTGRPIGQILDPKMLAGAASSLEHLDWSSQTPCSTAMVVALLIELEVSLEGAPRHADRFAVWIRTAGDPLTLATSWANFNRLAVKTSDLSELMSDTVRELSYLTYLNKERSEGREASPRSIDEPPLRAFDSEVEAFFQYRILLAMVVSLADGKLADLPLGAWRQSLPVDISYDPLRQSLSYVEEAIRSDRDPWPMIRDEHKSWFTQAVIAIAALGHARSSSELIVAQSLAAYYLSQPQLAEFVAKPFSRLVSAAWAKLCKVPALLSTPRVSVPAIERSLATGEPGWARTKAVLNAALGAVPGQTAREVRDRIAGLPDQ